MTKQWFDTDDPKLDRWRAARERRLAVINDPATDADTLNSELRALLGAVASDSVVRPPFYCEYGRLISLGKKVFVNFGVVMLDCAPIEVGAYTRIGPRAQLLAADHPRDHVERRAGKAISAPITVGENAWIGAGAVILPGVRIGDDAIIGACAVVGRDVPSGATVAGVPARIVESSDTAAPDHSA